MTTYATVLEYENAISPELNAVQDAELRRTIMDLLQYSKDKEKEKQEADNRELRPRPDGAENAAYYRANIDMDSLPTTTLKDLIEGLLAFVESLEVELQA
ncbi:MAG: hypothetical protein AAF990_14080 [Bacteroidota bacterium]